MEVIKSICLDCKREFEHVLEETEVCFDCAMKDIKTTD